MAAQKPQELLELEQLLEMANGCLEVRTEADAETPTGTYPVYSLMMGCPDTHAPVAGFFGGVHGLERIGSQVVLAFLRSLLERYSWDDALKRQLESVRLVFMPVVNPGGLWQNTRSTVRGVDLMRNAPVEALEKVPWLVGGQRISKRIAWYRGEASDEMEPESTALCRVVEREMLGAPFTMTLDCHSGFGARDRLWFPFAHTRKPVSRLAEIHAFRQLFDDAYANHDYIFEPQSNHYLTHGDLWDHLTLQSQPENEKVFLPLTLEMGSWRWVRKRPTQLFSRHGMFNPLVEHRNQRVLRRHLVMLEFIIRAASSYKNWLPKNERRSRHEAAALARWYPELMS